MSEYQFLISVLEKITTIETRFGAYMGGGLKGHISELVLSIEDRMDTIHNASNCAACAATEDV